MIVSGYPPLTRQVRCQKWCAARVLRGGSWNNSPRNARAAYRNENHRENRWNNAGFRLALSSCAAGRSAQDQVDPACAPCKRHPRSKAQGPRGASRLWSGVTPSPTLPGFPVGMPRRTSQPTPS
jgi:Sulfatase-modifying factor enzyme 1